MCNKKLQAAVNIKNDKAVIGEGIKEMQLEYYIVESDILQGANLTNGKVYGVEIIKKELTVNEATYMENHMVSDVCCSESNIKTLVDKLIHHTVTPVSLNCVLEDLVGVC